MTDPEKLIYLYLEDRLSPEQTEELEQRIQTDDDFAQLFACFGMLHSCIHNEFVEADLRESLNRFSDPSQRETRAAEADPDALLPGDVQDDENLERIKNLADKQLQAFLAQQEQLNQSRASTGRRPIDWRSGMHCAARKIDKAMHWTAKTTVGLSALAALVLITITLIHHLRPEPPARPVATLGETRHAQWAQRPEGNELWPGWLTLQRGYARLHFSQGAQVLVQAPCKFRLNGPNEMTCQSGTVTCWVPQQAQGFTVATPSSDIVDYGTEFGVSVDAMQQSEIHVFRGAVGLRSSRQEQPPATFTLRAGQNALTDLASGIQVGKSRHGSAQFIRELPNTGQLGIPGQRLSLADMVGGGNGLGTGLPACGLNAVDGSELYDMYLDGRGWLGFFKDTPIEYEYQVTSEQNTIDGVFIPIRRDNQLQVSSAGHRFDLPTIIERSAFRQGVINWCAPQPMESNTQLILDGIVYDSPARPAILMRRSKGITFDLERIRRDQAGVKIVEFSARCGVCASDSQIAKQASSADFYVLVDGVARFTQQSLSPKTGGVPITVALNAEDRYLTLLVAFSRKTGINRALFAAPLLELETP